MPPFDRRRAEWYIAGLMVWVAGLVLVVVRSGGTGRQTIVDLAGAIQLLAMFAACALITGIAFQFAREQTPTSDPSQPTTANVAVAPVRDSVVHPQQRSALWPRAALGLAICIRSTPLTSGVVRSRKWLSCDRRNSSSASG